MTGKKQKTSPNYSVIARRVLQGSEETAESKPSSGLYIVATPIGNLGDITLRALHTLATVDVIVCEDTRIAGKLLHHYGIKKPLISYHDHNADKRRPEILARLSKGDAIALVSDAGTPLISDPGYKLVQACRKESFAVIAIPGASSLLAALCSSGLPMDRFMFAGFLPSKRTARQKFLTELATINATLVFYSAPSRLATALEDMEKIFGSSRLAVVARELTKMFEEVHSATLEELVNHHRTNISPKGEIVVLVGPPEKNAAISPAPVMLDAMIRKALKSMSLRDAVAKIAKETKTKKSKVYNIALKIISEKA